MYSSRSVDSRGLFCFSIIVGYPAEARKMLEKNLENTKGIKIPLVKDWVTKYIMWVFNIYLDKNFPITRDELVKKLHVANIETRNAFVPINKQTVLVEKYGLFKEDDCPNANYIMENGFYLPSGNNIKNEEIDFICNKIIEHSKII